MQQKMSDSHGNTWEQVSRLDERQLERLEASAWAQIQATAGGAFRTHFGASVLVDHGVVRLRAARARDLSLNRVYALGIDSPLTIQSLDELIAEYRYASVTRFMISWAPVAQPAGATRWFEERGFRRIRPIVRLTRRTSPDVTAATGFSIVEAMSSDSTRFGDVAARSNGLPPEFALGLNSTMGRQGWRHYFANDGDRTVGTAALYTDGDYAWAGFGGTLPEDRGRGAQSALLARRIRDAYGVRARWITAWTTAETPERPNPSLHNMLRLGFDITYEIENFVLDLSAY